MGTPKMAENLLIQLTPRALQYKALVRSHLEHAVSVWSPHHKLLIEKLEKSTKRATKLVIAVKTLKYEERLKYLNLPALEYMRLRGDMIDAHKIFTGKYDTTVTS